MVCIPARTKGRYCSLNSDSLTNSVNTIFLIDIAPFCIVDRRDLCNLVICRHESLFTISIAQIKRVLDNISPSYYNAKDLRCWRRASLIDLSIRRYNYKMRVTTKYIQDGSNFCFSHNLIIFEYFS